MPAHTADTTPVGPRRRPVGPALTALSVGGFGIGLTEFVIAGLLTEVGSDLGVSLPAAGQLVGAYALTVAPGALVLTPLLMRYPPKWALVVLLGFFTVGNALSAWAPGYPVMYAGRIVAAMAHGGYFGIGAVLAGSLVPAHRRASAVAALFAGLTVANVLGVPAGTFIGLRIGWRAVFWIISAIGVLALAGIAALVPLTEPSRRGLPLGAQFRVLTRPQVLASLATTALVFGGMFSVFTYIEPLLRQVTGFPAGAIPGLLIVFGAGLFVGNIIGGRVADRDPERAVTLFAVLLPTVILGLRVVAGSQVGMAVGLFILGAVGFATVPGLQARVLQHAEGATILVSAVNIAAFNLGNSLGVTLAGLTIGAGFGLLSPTWVGTGLSTVGLGLIMAARWTHHKENPHQEGTRHGSPTH
ncbi:MAG: MFS transporter [Arachnia propionica]|uniref:MFS transporter n=1 Tax=Arachnia propionica TaxID=1750 RepID=UPI002710E148|nr:MFS transporter [Arachnia propionica]